MKIWLERRIPLGCDAGREKSWLIWGAVIGFLLDFRFVLAFFDARRDLIAWRQTRKVLVTGYYFPTLRELLGFSLWGCLVAAAAMAFLAVWHYSCHFRESKSIYTMRRLPQRWELLRRCLTVPVLAAAAYLIEAALLLGIDYVIYYYGLVLPARAMLIL